MAAAEPPRRAGPPYQPGRFTARAAHAIEPRPADGAESFPHVSLPSTRADR